MTTRSPAFTDRSSYQRPAGLVPVGILVAVLLPLILMPLGAVFFFALRGGLDEFSPP